MEPKAFLKRLKLIHAALAIGLLIFMAVSFIQSQGNHIFEIPSSEDDILVIVIPVIMLPAIVASSLVYFRFIAKINPESPLEQKLLACQTASIIRYALIEGPVLLSIVGFLMSGNLFYTIFTGAGLLYFLSIAPKANKIAEDLELTYDDRDKLGAK